MKKSYAIRTHFSRNHVDGFYVRLRVFEVKFAASELNFSAIAIKTVFVFVAARSPMHQSNMRFKTIAVHYQGDTSAYMSGGRVSPQHLERFDGNGRVRHPGGVYADWKPAYWVDDHAMERFFTIHQGVVTVKEHGLYYIYAQVRPPCAHTHTYGE